MPIKQFNKEGNQVTENKLDCSSDNQLAQLHNMTDEDFKIVEKLWEEAAKVGIFREIDSNSDWKLVKKQIQMICTTNYHRISWQGYFMRIAALVLLTAGLSFGLYRMISQNKIESGFLNETADNNHIREVSLPDGSKVSLNAESKLTYRNDFGLVTREVILEGEALFNVKPNKAIPFKVYIGESVIEVTGTSFTVKEEDGNVKVSVLTGTVLLSSTRSEEQKIQISANQSGYLNADHKIEVEDGIPSNELSWKTGHLTFDETPVDSALFDIARHFRRDLSLETDIKERLTAEFQDQTLKEILDELKIVAGLQFDTTGTALIVKK